MVAIRLRDQLPHEAAEQIVTVWDQNGPFGSITLQNGKLIATADQVARQDELERFLRNKRQLWMRRARKEGWQFDQQTCFDDLPRFLSGTLMFATRPLRSFDEALPHDLRLPSFDPFKRRQPRKHR